ncbi:MAG: hypothetical protein ACLUVC_10730 [Longibaculum sp.]
MKELLTKKRVIIIFVSVLCLLLTIVCMNDSKKEQVKQKSNNDYLYEDEIGEH